MNLLCDCGLALAGCSGLQWKWLKAPEEELKTWEPHCLPKEKERKIGHCSHLFSWFYDVFRTRKMMLTTTFQRVWGGWEDRRGKKESRVLQWPGYSDWIAVLSFFLNHTQEKKNDRKGGLRGWESFRVWDSMIVKFKFIRKGGYY